MKNILSILFLFALLASSCSEDELVRNQSSKSLKFTASFEENESRTYMGEGNLSECGFVIKLHDGKAFYEYSLDEVKGDKAEVEAKCMELESGLKQLDASLEWVKKNIDLNNEYNKDYRKFVSLMNMNNHLLDLKILLFDFH